MKKELTVKQREVLEFIRQKVRNNLPPTIREIAKGLGFSSTGTVRDYLHALELKGYLKRSNNKSRAIELLQNAFRIPILGSIPAGRPNLAYEDIEGYLDADDLFLGRLSQDDVFALRVKGDSMTDAGILDNDVAVIKKQSTCENGRIVAALLDNNEVTLKRLVHKLNRYHLEAANPHYAPIFEEFKIIGKLMTVIRKY